MKTDRIFGQPSTFRIIGKCLTVTDFGGVVQKARKNTASPAIVGGIGQADCLDGAELSAPSSGWNKRPSGISGDQLTKVKNKAPPEISDGQHNPQYRQPAVLDFIKMRTVTILSDPSDEMNTSLLGDVLVVDPVKGP